MPDTARDVVADSARAIAEADELRREVARLRAAIAAQGQAEPMFWVRLCSDGGYEGPIHNSAIERVRKLSGAWSPLYTHPPAAQPAQPVAVPDVGKMEYEGTLVAFIFQKMRAYRSAIDNVWAVLASHGYQADGATRIDDMVLRAILAAPAAPKHEPLTDAQINTLTAEQLAKADQTLPVYLHHREFARAVERALGITKEPQ